MGQLQVTSKFHYPELPCDFIPQRMYSLEITSMDSDSGLASTVISYAENGIRSLLENVVILLHTASKVKLANWEYFC